MENGVNEIMSDVTDDIERQTEGDVECRYHPGQFANPDRGIPCTACEDGEPPEVPQAIATRDFTVIIRGTIRSEILEDTGAIKLQPRRMRREVRESIILDDRVATFKDVEVIVKK